MLHKTHIYASTDVCTFEKKEDNEERKSGRISKEKK